MPRHHGTDTAEIRRAANRLVDLEILSSFTPDDDAQPTEYVAVTGAREILTVPAGEARAYLRGLAHGAHVRDVKPHHPLYAYLAQHPACSLDDALQMHHDALDDGRPFCRTCTDWHAPDEDHRR